jgi:putative ABC transport system ATP-binding protein
MVPPEQSAAVTVRTVDLWKTYRIGTIEYSALRGVSISIKKGEFVATVGPSGSGKTTLLNLIGTIDRPSKGEIYLDGVATSKLKGSQLASVRNKTLSFVFQFFNLIPYLTARENAELPLLASGASLSERREKVTPILEQLGLGDKVDKKPKELSGGEQQRVAIARSLANDPSIILADEPTGNLDTTNSEAVVRLLSKICEERKVTIIMVTHNLELTAFCHRVIYLRDGLVEKEIVQF